VSSYEVQERLLKYPLSKNELVDYLIRLQNGSGKFAKSTYKRLMQHPNFKEILDEVQNQRTKKRECKQIMDMCLAVQSDTQDTLNKVKVDVIE